MTWMTFDGDEPITGSDFDDPRHAMRTIANNAIYGWSTWRR